MIEDWREKIENRPMVLSLFDYTGAMVQPWLKAGFNAYIVDLQHSPGRTVAKHLQDNVIIREGADMKTWIPPRWIVNEVCFIAAFPPCTNLAVSGARWMTDESRGKGLPGLIDSLALVERARYWLNWFQVPGFFENPVSTISTYYRKPDFTFHPYEYTGWCAEDNYVKKTCLWAYNGFEKPEPFEMENRPEPDERIWRAGPSEERANFRSATPMGFAKAVFEQQWDERFYSGIPDAR